MYRTIETEIVNGYEVIYSNNCFTTKCVKRSWNERLFSLPWKPLKKYKIIQEPTIYFSRNKFVAHPYLKSNIIKYMNVYIGS
jgi:hypothetical protein